MQFQRCHIQLNDAWKDLSEEILQRSWRKLWPNIVDRTQDAEVPGDDLEVLTLVPNVPCFKNISVDEIAG